MGTVAQENGHMAIGCAGWAIRPEHAELFPGTASHLVRYAGSLPAVELNTSFYRPHRRATYERWAKSVPDDFRFAVKLPREITHERRFVDAIVPLERFLDEISGLGDRLGPILIQLPPSMDWSRVVAERFLTQLRCRFDGQVALEPRHATWFEQKADDQLRAYRVARVAADPCVVPPAGEPGGWNGLVYYRLHGSPKMYESPYGEERLADIGRCLAASTAQGDAWCIFDNTKFGAAVVDALALLKTCVPRTEPGVTANSSA